MTAERFTVPMNYRCIQDNLTKEHYICEDKTEAINLAYLLNDLHKENKQLLCTIVEILDFIEDKREVSIEEMRKWWKEKEKELMYE